MSERTTPTIYRSGEHSLSRRSIDNDALKILYRLNEHGYKAYIVGGGVRDLLLDRKPKDFDIATDATPRQVKSLFRNCRIIGRRFKLAHIFFQGGKIIEVSTFRDTQDQFDGEQEEIQGLAADDNVYGTAETDAFRRDITINALFYDAATASIIDYVGGMNDIRNRTVRVIGDPEIRYQEDPVRMTRVIRQACRTGFEIESGARAAIIKHHNLLKSVPPMRLFEEFKKDIVAGSFFETLRELEAVELLHHLLPEIAGRNLITNGTYLGSVLRRFDELFLIDEPVSVTAALAVLALGPLLQESDSNLIVEQFIDERSVEDHLGGSFSALAVPRKEREKIQDIVVAWFKLKSRGPDESALRQVLRSGVLADVRQFSRLLANRESDEEIVSMLDELLASDVPQNGGHFRTGGGRRRRGGARGRRGFPQRGARA